MTLKPFGRIMSAKSFVLFAASLAALALQAFDTPYLTFRSATTFSLSATKAWDGTLQMATSNPADGLSWSDWTGESITAELSDGQYYIYLRGTGNTVVNNSYTAWTLTGSNVYCEGDIETLRGYDGNVPAMGESCYKCMFKGCTAIRSIPSFSATTVPTLSYYQMFQNCTSLEINTSGAGVEWSFPAGTTGTSIWNYDMFSGTAGTFTDNPVPGTTYYVASALPYGQLYQKDGSGTLAPVFSGTSVSIDLTPTIKNGVTPYAFTFASGTLPPGLEISGATLAGMPTTPGTYDFTLSVSDAESHSLAAAAYQIIIMQKTIVSTPFIRADCTPDTADCIELNTGITTLEDGEWYVVNGVLNYGVGGLVVSGSANLVLADGASLTVTGATKKAGVNVASGNTLTVYCQAAGTGALNASGNPNDGYSYGGAGIGGGDKEDCGTIIINGGVITASGGNYVGAGIGGGYNGDGGTVVINGGTITAIGGTWYGAGIGGGYYGAGGNATIKGGTITATAGSSGGVGIGKGYYGSAGTLTVGGAVCVKAGYSANPTTELEHGEGGVITVGSQRYFYVETLGLTLLDGALDAYTNENKTWDLNETLVGGATPYSFSGTVPDGLSLTSAGTLSGAVATAGSYPFTVTVTDDAEDSKNFTYTLIVSDPDPLSAQTNLGTVKIGKSTNFNLAYTISGGVPPYTFAFVGDHAPEFSLSGGALSFLSASAGNYSCAIAVADKLGTTLTPAPVYTVEAVASTGYTDDDPEEPADGDSVDCLTPDGVFQRVCRKLTSSDTVWEDCWYYAEGNVSISGVAVKGKVSLVLCDGAVLTIQGSSSKAGIAVTNDCALTVYGQTAGSGKLNATGGFYSAGIGGGNNESAGTINIYGGEITATGGFYGSAIGGGQYGNGGTVTINGGVVTANGYFSSGIGGGYNGTAGGRVVVNGGTVTAIGHTSVSTYYPGIGVYGSTKDQGTLKVGSRIEVKAGNSTTLTEADKLTPDVDGEVSLSTQRYCYIFETVGPTPLMQATSTLAAYSGEEAVFNLAETVSGGTPDYTFEIKEGSSLPAGFTLSGTTLSCVSASAGGTFVLTVKDASSPQQSEDFAYTITVSARPKTITYMDGDTPILGLTPSEYVEGTGATLSTTAPAAPGYEFEGWYLNSGLTGDKVTAIDAEATGPQTFYANWQPIEYTVAYMDGDTQITDQGLTPTTYTVESATLTLPATATKTGKGFYGWYTNSTCTGDAVTTIPAGSTGNKTFWAKWGAVKSMETYVDAGGNAMPAVECAQVASDTTTLETGWYVVKGEVAISGRVTVSGSVNLILADGASLSVVNDVWREAAVNVPEGASLTVYLQTAGANASLSVTTTGSSAAGIGGNTSENAGTVTINGGTITATGGQNGAGIGGGNSASGGVVVINGGTVTARGGQFGAGIGGGYQGNGGTVTVNGGSVTAYSVGDNPSGIGMGYSGTSNGSLAVGSNLSVKSGTGSDALGELTVGVNGAVTLDGKRYYVVEPIGPVPLAQTTSAFDAYVNEAFELSLPGTVSGGSGSYSFTLKDSTLPAWLTRTGDTLSGTPTAADSWTFTFTVSDTVETSLEDVDCTYTITATTRPQPIVYMDGSAVMSGLTPSNYIEGVGVVLPDLASKTGYLFLGWYTAANGGDRVYTISTAARGQQTVYAHWTARNYNITYMDGATTMSGLTPTIYDIESATINLPEPLAPEGKVFVGWFTDSGFNTPATSIPHGSIGDKTFYVKWRDAQAGEGEVAVTFIDADGSERTENCKVITSAMTTLESGWYVVNNDVTINSFVTIDGDVKIVLVDEKKLTVNAKTSSYTMKPGIWVAPGNALTIYAQANGSGALEASGDDYGAGIGSGYNNSVGSITINGGVITATGRDAAGIGGGQSGVCGTVTINRGTVVATGGGNAPGIGSGSSASAGGTIVINGGDVTATGGSLGAAGIGGGNNCPGGVVTITGGTVVATGTSGAGIGGSGSGAGATVTITGGSVTATAGAAYRYGIGGGNTATDQGTLTVGEGMVVRAGEGENPTDELTIDANGVVTLVARRYYVVDDGSVPIGPTMYEIQYFDGMYNQIPVQPSSYEAGTVTQLGEPAEKPGYVFVGWYTLPNFNSEVVTQIGTEETGLKQFYGRWVKVVERATVDYLDVDGETKSVECAIIAEEMDLLTNGWYAVTNNVTLTHGLSVTNDVKLIVADGVTLTVSNGTFGKAGIHVPSDSSLVIFGQVEDSGVLSATGANYAAGIGSDKDETGCGLITINGVNVTARGGSKGAGVGGGNGGTSAAVTVNGGTVTARGGEDAAGIGGGYKGSCGDVTINGGTVTANGGGSTYESGAGIGGGGYEGNGGNVVINGGTVTATSGGRYSDGIGKGSQGTSGTLKAGEGVVVWAGESADSAEQLDQKKDDGTFWIFGTQNYFHAEEATATSEFTITYWDENGESTYDLEPSSYISGTGLAELPQPERAGYTFGGWWSSRNVSTAEQVTEIPAGSSGNVTLYAKWNPILYTITYVTDPMDIDISGFSPKAYYTGTSTALPTPAATKPYYVFESWYTNAQFTGESFTRIASDWTGDRTLYANWVIDESKIAQVTFVGADGAAQTEDCFVLDTTVTTLEEGWYVVNGDLNYGSSGLSVSGTVNLVLADDSSLVVTGALNKAGIAVPAGSSLAIFTQAEGTGFIDATGASAGGAGIGASYNGTCGHVVVHGGMITATAQTFGAGVGGSNGDGGSILVEGGTVTARSLNYGAGIGGGYNGAGGLVTINGGTVVAISDYMGAGIGGGIYGDGGTVAIKGGTVTATGGTGCAGIGKGSGGSREVALTVSSGLCVYAGDVADPVTTFDVDADTGDVTITGNPRRYFVVKQATSEPEFQVVDGVLTAVNLKDNTEITIPSTVVAIGDSVFRGKTGLERVVIPDSVKEIGEWSFDGCTGLGEVDIGSGVTNIAEHAFSGCSALTELVIPGSVEYIGESAFRGCTSLASLTLSEGLKVIDTYAFYGCSVLTCNDENGLYFPDTMEEIGVSAFVSCPLLAKVSLPGSLYEPGVPSPQAFYSPVTTVTYRTDEPIFTMSGDTLTSVDMNGHTSAVIPGTVKKIGAAAFRNISTLQRVTVPSSVTNIATSAFLGCSNLVEVSISEGLETISAGAFQNCASITNLTIPASVMAIGNQAFKDCVGLETVTVLSGEIGVEAFYGCASLSTLVLGEGVTLIGNSAFRGCMALTAVTIPGGVTEIDSSAFWGCANISEVTICAGVGKTIGDWAFNSCTSLATLSIGEGVTNICERAFGNCKALTTLDLPDSVEAIGEAAFSGCDKIVTLSFGSGLKTVGAEAFDGCSMLEHGEDGIYFPDGTTSIGADVFRMCNKLTKVSLPASLYANGIIHPSFDYWQFKVDYRGVAPVFYVEADSRVLRSVDLKGVRNVTVPDSVRDIFIGTFAELDALESIVIPSCVTNIGNAVFNSCSNLVSVTISEGVQSIGEMAFFKCSSLTNVTIPDSVTSLGESVFWYCTGLKSATLGSGITVIPEEMFERCSSLENVTFRGAVTEIGRWAFSCCSSLDGVILPDSLSYIGWWAFADCSSLSTITIPKGVEIDGAAFSDCVSLRNVNISGEVKRMKAKLGRMLIASDSSDPDATTVGEWAFFGCRELEEVIVGSKVEEMGGGVFAGCTKLNTITVEAGNDNFRAENGMFLSKDGTTLISGAGSIATVTVPDGVTTISDGAFSGFSTLQNVVLPIGVATIGEAVFSNATAFATITIPSSVTSVGENAFFGTGLTTVYVSTGDKTRVQGLVSGTGYDISGVSFFEPGEGPSEIAPSIDGDPDAAITGNAEDGYTITPSAAEGTVEVTIPSGLDAEKVTVEVPPTATVKPNGANVKIVKTVETTSYDITAFLDIPAAVEGVIDLNNATVKETIVKEALDPTEDGVDIDLDPSDPSITTAKTRPGLTYTFSEGTTLDNMVQKTTYVGDGESWTPPITVKGGTSGFYSIGVTK